MKSIFISGYKSGLGKEIHDLLSVNAEHELFFIGRADGVEINKGNVHYINADLSSNDYNWVNDLGLERYEFGDVVFINNAATIEPIDKIEECSVHEIENSMRINYFSPMYIIKKLKELSEKLLVINITSGAANKAVPLWLGYCASKAAMKISLDVVADEKGIEVIHFDPGVMDTKMQDNIRKESNKHTKLRGFVDIYNSGALRNPRDVALELVELVKL